MANREQRSNREQRKPKKEKVVAKPGTPLGSQVKLAGSPSNPGSGKRK
jgi:hypothetical protein